MSEDNRPRLSAAHSAVKLISIQKRNNLLDELTAMRLKPKAKSEKLISLD